MTRTDHIQAAVSQALLAGPCTFDDLMQRVRRAFPDAEATEVDQAARSYEGGEVGRRIYSLESTPEAQAPSAKDQQLALFGETT